MEMQIQVLIQTSIRICIMIYCKLIYRYQYSYTFRHTTCIFIYTYRCEYRSRCRCRSRHRFSKQILEQMSARTIKRNKTTDEWPFRQKSDLCWFRWFVLRLAFNRKTLPKWFQFGFRKHESSSQPCDWTLLEPWSHSSLARFPILRVEKVNRSWSLLRPLASCRGFFRRSPHSKSENKQML